MTKEIFEKITKKRNFLDVSDISVDEKKILVEFLVKKGFTTSTFYLRFFQKGFYDWEILGVTECKKRFLELPDVAQVLLEYVDEEDPAHLEGDKGYLYTLAQSDEAGVFYDCLLRVKNGLCGKFFVFMDSLGMSQGTTIKRFKDENWKPWEVQGMKAVLEEYCSQDK